jgi:hypothetical protein
MDEKKLSMWENSILEESEEKKDSKKKNELNFKVKESSER